MLPAWIVLLFHTALILIVHFPKDTLQSSLEDRIIRDIFRGYNPFARPVENENEGVKVSFGLDLQQIIDLDERNERLITSIWLNYNWHDPKLKWDPKKYGGIESIRVPPHNVWTPDILLYNSVDDKIDSKFPPNVVVNSSGNVNWIPIGIYRSACTVKIRWFPFDDQLCPLKFGSWTYDATKINMTQPDLPFVTDGYSESGEWEILDLLINLREFHYPCCPQPYNDMTFYLYLRRRPLYYGFNLIIPCALISSLTLVTFIMPPDANEKITLGINILLTLTFNAKIVADKIPSTSMEVPIIGIYFCCIQIVCAVSVIMTVLVLNFHHRNPSMYKIPAWVRIIICEWLAWVLQMHRPGRDLSRVSIKRKRKMKDLEAKLPHSRSLISNVREDSDDLTRNGILPFKPQNRSFDDLSSFKSELSQILTEVRFITYKMKEDHTTAEEVSDWKFAALVIDRLCLIVFTIYTLVVTVGVFSAAIFCIKDTAEPYPNTTWRLSDTLKK